MRGIILAGGRGTRLSPLTRSISKQLLPVYDKPMIYYPLSTLMLIGIREVLIISTPEDLGRFKKLLGDGSQWGMTLSYEEQAVAGGIAQALLIGERFVDGHPSCLILGDNLFFGQGLGNTLIEARNEQQQGATIFAYRVQQPERYGVVEFDQQQNAVSIEEKPANPKSKYAITGIYFYDGSAVEKARQLKPSARGELEITDLNNEYLNSHELKVGLLGRGIAWFDTGTHDALMEAGQFVQTIEKRQGLKIGVPEELAWRQNWIDDNQLLLLADAYEGVEYGKYLAELLQK